VSEVAEFAVSWPVTARAVVVGVDTDSPLVVVDRREVDKVLTDLVMSPSMFTAETARGVTPTVDWLTEFRLVVGRTTAPPTTGMTTST